MTDIRTDALQRRHHVRSLTKNTYDVFGVPGSGNAGRFQYTGQIWLADAGLYHYKARA